MLKEEFYKIKLGATVVCFKEEWDMNFGWEDDMSDMLGINLIVLDIVKTPDNLLGLTLEHPDTGSRFTFDYRILNVIEEKKYGPFIVNGFKYQQKIKLSFSNLSNHTLDPDFEILKKMYKNETHVVINKNIYLQIKKECPRIIGVLLGNNFLIKTKN